MVQRTKLQKQSSEFNWALGRLASAPTTCRQLLQAASEMERRYGDDVADIRLHLVVAMDNLRQAQRIMYDHRQESGKPARTYRGASPTKSLPPQAKVPDRAQKNR